jgi:dihydroflavonol-4-reductase
MTDELTFVTGATGFIGSHVVRLLRARRDRVRILARDPNRAENIQGLGCEIVMGDLRDAASLVRCVQGCRWVYHVGADYRLWSRNPQEIYASNVAGTRNLLSACCEAGVDKVVYTSTVGTIGMRPDGVPTDEDTPVALDDMIGHYKRSKFMAEQVALEFAHSGLPVVIDYLRGRLPAYVDTGLNIVSVEDVAQGHILAESKGKIGERYILGGENLTLQEILEILARICGSRMPRFPMPWFAALIAAYLDQFFMGTILRREPSIPLEGVRMARHKMFVSSAKACRELGYNPRPAEQALREAVDYFRGVWRVHSAQDRLSKVRAGAA